LAEGLDSGDAPWLMTCGVDSPAHIIFYSLITSLLTITNLLASKLLYNT
jgi:hypothetical protein